MGWAEAGERGDEERAEAGERETEAGAEERGEVITPDNGSRMARHSLDNASVETV